MVVKVKHFLAFAVLLALLALPLTATAVAPAPTLSEVQRWKLQTLTQRVENIQLRAQILQLEFDAAKQTLTTMLDELEVPGYTFDLQSMAYTPVIEKQP